MMVEEVEKLSRRELRRRANECFRLADTRGVEERPGQIPEAEFFMRELERRWNSSVSIRDFVLEIVVIALIGWEIRMGYRQEASQKDTFEKEEAVLTNLQVSSKATADTIIALKSTTDMMNGALQKQLALFYDVSVNIVFDPEKKELQFLNNGRTNVSIWAMRNWGCASGGCEGRPYYWCGQRIPNGGDDGIQSYDATVSETEPRLGGF